MNVVLHSAMNTNGWNRELTLKCIKVLIDPMNNPLGISPSKGFFLCLVWFPVSLY